MSRLEEREAGWRAVCLAAVIAAGCAGSGPQRVTEPVPGIPHGQQRTVSRDEFRRLWPFSVAGGTLGCSSNAVVFRSAGVNYALNEAARDRGFAPVGPIRLTRHARPSNPLARIKQDRRVAIFAQLSGCPDDRCRNGLRRAHGLSDAELKQIHTEGVERRWPPLAPERASLDPLIEAGLILCRDGSEQRQPTPAGVTKKTFSGPLLEGALCSGAEWRRQERQPARG